MEVFGNVCFSGSRRIVDIAKSVIFICVTIVGTNDIAASAELQEKPPAEARNSKSRQFAVQMAQHKDDTFESILEKTKRKELSAISFDSNDCQFIDRIRNVLPMKDDVSFEKFRKQGFLRLHSGNNINFGQAYYQVYGLDLPVLITSDSILHVVHCSLDNTVRELEEQALVPLLQDLLVSVHNRLDVKIPPKDPWIDSYHDVDLYLTVARNLSVTPALRSGGALAVSSRMHQDEKVGELLRLIGSLHMQRGPLDPLAADYTEIYGGKRPIDYSQFKPRGHYTQSEKLQSYFRAMMWLGRADCGFSPLPMHPEAGLFYDPKRELRDAAILSELFGSPREKRLLAVLNDAIALLAGESDNLRPAELRTIMEKGHLSLAALRADSSLERKLSAAVEKSPQVQQQIASQVYLGVYPFGEPIPPPALVQTLGQRFAIDSFVLSNVVYDMVQEFDQLGRRRWMPRGLDVMAALGNHEAVGLLEDDLRRWKYAPQLTAAQEITNEYLNSPGGQRSIYDLWLKSLATLQDDGAEATKFPEVMRTRAWHLKQLQTQLASWAELRHDLGILYAKQSYTRGDGCMYPSAYVEPYPQLYARLAKLSERMANMVANVKTDWSAADRVQAFWQETAATMKTLERLTHKELAGEAFTDDENSMLKKTISIHQTHDPDYGTKRDYSGWYCKLLYPRPDGIDKWRPTVADVHTDPNCSQVLEVGVGGAQLAVVAVDNGPDHMAFVGPIYTHYEFTQPVENRLTDEEFGRMLQSGHEPASPSWAYRFGQ